ncbi:hypothetical protein BGZ83_005394, partial [Gryganskiella cystojenkinii]
MDIQNINTLPDVATTMAHGLDNKLSPEPYPISLHIDPPEAVDTIGPSEKDMAAERREDPHEETLLMPTVRPRHNLGQDLSTSQRWRLSMNGTPEVFGTICDAPLGEEYQQQQEQEQEQQQEQQQQQQVQQSQSPTQDDAATSGNLDLQTLFPDEWDKTHDDVFEALVTVFDERPFGQGYDLTFPFPYGHFGDGCNDAMGSSGMENLVQSLGMDSDSTRTSSHHSTSSLLSSAPDSPLFSPATTPSPEPRSSDASTHQSDSETVKDEQQSSTTLRGPVSCNSLSRLILRFLRDLPDALIPRDVFAAMSSLVQLQGQDSITLLTMSMLLRTVSDEQQHLLQFILELVDDLVKTVDRFKNDSCNNVDNTINQDQDPPVEGLARDEINYKGCIERIYRVLGLVCTASTSVRQGTSQDRKLSPKATSSLFGLYRNCIEQKIAQAQLAGTTANAMMVFRYMVQFRAQIFSGNSLRSCDQHHPIPTTTRDSQQGDYHFESGYQSDTALVEQRRAEQPWKHNNHWRMRGRRRKRQEKPSALDTKTVEERKSTETLCDSAVEIRGQDLLALAILYEHSARTKGHAPRPSVATMHSIMAEGHSVHGDHAEEFKEGWRSLETLNPGDAAIETIEKGGKVCLDRFIDENDSDRARKRGEMGFTDFLQEPLDRKYEEREIQLVEQDIIRSELTSKFLANNLVGLYPSSSPTSIPAIILPSARHLLQPVNGAAGDLVYNGHLAPPSQESTQLSPRLCPRELLLTPKEQVILPEDHIMSDGCVCSYCTTLVQPSKVPVLSKEEYELAELKSQCVDKDQHVTELLKTVQSLQGQVNILNAKLLFLHDHHTTRPMRRRTLARNSYPILQSAPVTISSDHLPRNGCAQGLDSNHFHQTGPRSAGPAHTASSITTVSNGSSPPTSRRSLSAFAEGIRLSNDNDAYPPADYRQLTTDLGNPDLQMLDDDEAMSFLDLNDGRPPPPNITQSRMQPWSGGHLITQSGFGRNIGDSIGAGSLSSSSRVPRYETELERALRDVEEAEEEEPEREGEDLLDEFYYKDAYKTMDQQLYRRPVLPFPPPPRPMSTDQYKKHHRMSLPIQSLMSKRISLRDTFRWKGKTTSTTATAPAQ